MQPRPKDSTMLQQKKRSQHKQICLDLGSKSHELNPRFIQYLIQEDLAIDVMTTILLILRVRFPRVYYMFLYYETALYICGKPMS